ncbi:hypothetical protein OEG84_02680 [Hoeflea sp. G2-23]|uniref:Flagellar hook-length control protein-like C-terminal domain-containing protein n=1 Tax=Hoeflea algicola TaxID=2983763 RepID=A0ABT3Z4F5_9HYPH|nr:hypothetical protein [Hoeflea algicola]MCY0146649.1 hypothetical protein [Hoeflea algicola]
MTAQSILDAGFANDLQRRLEATVGRATRDIGQPTRLDVSVLDRGSDASPLGLFGDSRRAATVNLLLSDADTGVVLSSRALRVSAAGYGPQRDSGLMARLVADIRAVLGLSGYAPHPVGGVKRPVVQPHYRADVMEDVPLTDMELLADPLLNGTVTPTSFVIDSGSEAAPVADLSRPLLSAEPTVAEPAIRGAGDDQPMVAKPIPSPAGIVVPQALELPASAPSTEPDKPVTSDDDDVPCIITVDNDCIDPDSR